MQLAIFRFLGEWIRSHCLSVAVFCEPVLFNILVKLIPEFPSNIFIQMSRKSKQELATKQEGELWFHSFVAVTREISVLFVVFQWELICNRNHLKALTQASYLAGLLIGSYAFSSISDHFGRRIAVFLSIAFLVSKIAEKQCILPMSHLMSCKAFEREINNSTAAFSYCYYSPYHTLTFTRDTSSATNDSLPDILNSRKFELRSILK